MEQTLRCASMCFDVLRWSRPFDVLRWAACFDGADPRGADVQLDGADPSICFDGADPRGADVQLACTHDVLGMAMGRCA